MNRLANSWAADNKRWIKAVCGVLLMLLATSSHAYVGPGLGLGTLVAIAGVLGSILLALFAVLWYPLKRLFKKSSPPKSPEPEQDNDDSSSSDDNGS